MNERLNPMYKTPQKALKAGAKTYDGSRAVTVTADDLGALPTSGGELTGDLTLSGATRAIKYKNSTRTGSPITMYAGTLNGSEMVIGDGGRVIIGGGESAAALHNALSTASDAEEMHIANDGAIYLHTNCQSITARKTVTIDNSGKITAPGGFEGTFPVFATLNNVSANTMRNTGVYRIYGTSNSDMPDGLADGDFFFLVFAILDPNWLIQVGFDVRSPSIYIRNLQANVWSKWQKLTSSAVGDPPLPGPEIIDDYAGEEPSTEEQ